MNGVEDYGQWEQRILGAVERLGGAASCEAIEAAWSTHAVRELTELTLFGPYSAGKSTIIRRLLIDEGHEIPDWLTVSARRETFELNEVDIHGVTLTDTPGIAASAERHDALAEDALVLTDAFMLVVPPQLLTSSRDLVKAVLSGEFFFGHPSGGVTDLTIAVISRADDLGIDPEDNLDGMRELAGRKRHELRDQLVGSDAAGDDTMTVLVVAADPYEEQARHTAPSTDAYDATRQWDGIDTLTSAVAALAGRRDELRVRARIRYLARVALKVREQSNDVINGLTHTIGELEARQSVAATFRRQFDGMLDAARADLEERVITSASAAAEASPADRKDAASDVESRLNRTLETWADRWSARFDQLVAEADVEIDRRLGRPASISAAAFLEGLTVPAREAGEPAPNSRVITMLNRVRNDVNEATRAAFRAKTGRSIESVLADWERAKHPKGGAETSRSKTGSAGSRLGATAQALDAGAQLAGSVLAIATVVEAEIRQASLDSQMQEQRDRARTRIEEFAHELASSIIDGNSNDDGWAKAVDDAMRAIGDGMGLTDSNVEVLGAELANVRAAVDELDGLLAGAPVMG